MPQPKPSPFFLALAGASILLFCFGRLFTDNPYLPYLSFGLVSICLFLSSSYARFPTTRRILSVVMLGLLGVSLAVQLSSR